MQAKIHIHTNYQQKNWRKLTKSNQVLPLGLSPSSPDAAIFTNTTTAPTTTPTGASATEQSDASIITTHGPDHLFGPLAIAMAIFIYTYSTDQSMITF